MMGDGGRVNPPHAYQPPAAVVGLRPVVVVGGCLLFLKAIGLLETSQEAISRSTSSWLVS